MRRLAGVDGCAAGWLAVAMPDGAPERATVRLASRAPDLLPLADVIAIDMPIGLMDAPQDGPRPADTAARAFLRAQNADDIKGPGSRVFASPSRAHLAVWRNGGDYAALRAAFPPPRSLSKQCWMICPKIAELDTLLGEQPDAPIHESHPEVAFAHWAGRTLAPKKSPLGVVQRGDLLRGMGFDLSGLVAALGPFRGWEMDDLLDACILTRSAHRIAHGTATWLPLADQRDTRGRRCTIAY